MIARNVRALFKGPITLRQVCLNLIYTVEVETNFDFLCGGKGGAENRNLLSLIPFPAVVKLLRSEHSIDLRSTGVSVSRLGEAVEFRRMDSGFRFWQPKCFP